MRNAIDTLNGYELNGKRITLIEEAKGRQKSSSGGSRSRSNSPRSMFRSRSRSRSRSHSRSRSRSRSANIVEIGAGEATKVTGWICNFCNDPNEDFRYSCVTCQDARPVDEKRKTIGAIPEIKSGTFSLQLKIVTVQFIV